MSYKKIEALKEGDILKSRRTKELIRYLGDYKDDENIMYATFRDKEYNSGFHLIRKDKLFNFFDSLDKTLVVYEGRVETCII